MGKQTQKLYCFMDETGQDAGSDFFIVVTIVNSGNQDDIRNSLLNAEKLTKVHARKWFNSRSPVKEEFLLKVMREEIAKGGVYYGKTKKPVAFFLPMVETLANAIKDKAGNQTYSAIVYVDGIDKKKAQELTRYLRQRGVKLEYVRSIRDESEPFIRLADRWAGCIRDALEGKNINKEIITKAEKTNYIKAI